MESNNQPFFADLNLLQQAEQSCKQTLKTDPDSRAALRSLAAVCRKLGRLEEAAALYQRVFHLDPEDQEAAYMHAVFSGAEWIAPAGLRAAPFFVLKDFLPREVHSALLPFALSVQNQFVSARVGKAQLIPEFRTSLEFRPRCEGKLRFHEQFMSILPLIHSRLQLPASEIELVEVQLSAYLDGHFYQAHMDAPAKNLLRANRYINFVYFFHRVPRPYTGGELVLFDTDVAANTFTRTAFTRIVPEDNSIVIFPPNFYHGVLPVRCPSNEFADSRFVLNGHVVRKPAVEEPAAALEMVGA